MVIAAVDRPSLPRSADLGLMLGAWGGTGVADLDDDGSINGADPGLLLGARAGLTARR